MDNSQNNKGDFATVYLTCGKATVSGIVDILWFKLIAYGFLRIK